MDRQSLFHPATSIADHLKNGPTIIAGGSGVRIEGPQRPRVDRLRRRAVVRQHRLRPRRDRRGGGAGDARPRLLPHLRLASNEPIIRLADRVLSLFHEKAGAGHLSKVFFGTLGLGRQRHQLQAGPLLQQPAAAGPQKKKIISRLGGYHGLTYAAGSLTGIPVYHKAFDLPVRGRAFTPPARTSTALPRRARARQPSPTAWSPSSRR